MSQIFGFFGRNTKNSLQISQTALFITSLPSTSCFFNQQRAAHTKHWNPKWKKMRAQKVIKINIPKFHEKSEDLTKDEIKSRLKEKGLLPPRPWVERPFNISSTGAIFEAYVPPEGDGKKSAISTAGAKQSLEFLQKKSKSMMAVRKIRSYEEDFSPAEFALIAQDIYIEAHRAMVNKEKYKLREVVTERAYPEMVYNVKDKTIHWDFLKSLEPPRVVHIRCTDVISKDNIYAQVTVRFHTQQRLAIYDRFGRLMHGSEILAKDVLEYVVFEKNISNEYGTWRLHDKIIPDWMPPKDPATITYRIVEETQAADTVGQGSEEAIVPQEDSNKKGQTSNIATA